MCNTDFFSFFFSILFHLKKFSLPRLSSRFTNWVADIAFEFIKNGNLHFCG